VFWVVLFVVIALAGLAMLVGYAVWLTHKTADVLNELLILGKQADQLAGLLAQIRVPGSLPGEQGPRNPSI